MKGKALVLIGGVTGYVLGTRAGRARYEQIRSVAGRVWGDPRVQEARRNAADQVKDQVKDKAPQVEEAVAAAATRAADAARDKLGNGDAGAHG